MTVNKSRTRNYFLGVSTSYITTLVSMVIGLWFTPFVLRYISPEAFGINSVMGNLVLWTQIFTLGFPAWLSLYLSQRMDSIEIDELNRHTSTIFWLQLVASILTLGMGLLVAMNISNLFTISPELQDQARLVVLLIFITVVLGLMEQPFSMLLIAHQQIHYNSLMQLTAIIIRTALSVVLLMLGFNVVAIALGIFVGALIGMIFVIRQAYRLTPGLDVRLRFFSNERIGEMFSLSFWWTLSYIAGIAIQNTDQILAGRLVSLEAVAVMGLTGRLFTLATSGLFQLARSARPMLGQLIGQNDMARVEQVYQQLFLLSTGVALAISMALWAGNGIFVRAWVGEALYGGAWLGLAFALNILVNTWMQPALSLLASMMIARQQAQIRLIEGVLNVLLSIWLAQYFGIVGIVMATSLAAVCTSLLYLPYLVSRSLKRPFIPFITSETVPLLKAALLIVPAAVVLEGLTRELDGFVPAALVIGLSFAFNMAVLWWLAFDDAIRERLLRLIRPIMQRAQRFLPILAKRGNSK
jgi:O-antigen/teichoic acid export membrane protein